MNGREGPRRGSRNVGKVALALAALGALTLGGVALAASSTTVRKQVTVQDGQAGVATASCPSGYRATGAGFKTTTTNQTGVILTALAPTLNAVKARAFSLEGNGVLRSVAHCSELRRKGRALAAAKGGPRRVTGSKLIQPGEGTAVARCPKGTSVRFGGFRTPAEADVSLVVRAITRPSARELHVRAKNNLFLSTRQARGPAPHPRLTAIAICGKGPKLTPAKAKASVQEETNGSAVATCPRGKRASFGGFSVPFGADGIYPNVLLRTGNRSWRAGVQAFSSTEITALVYCRKA